MTHNGLVDIYRFIASIIIVADHVGVGLGIKGFPCDQKGYHVIFFFMLTGFLTMWHFERTDDDVWEYTKHKFVRLIPYTVISVVTGYILLFSYDTGVFVHLKKAFYSIFEILLLGEIPLLGQSHMVPPLWQLSSMLICFPVVCWLVKKMKNNKVVYGAVLYSSVIGLDSLMYFSAAGFPVKLLFALSCMMTGCMLYDVVKRVDELETIRFRQIIRGGGIVSFFITVIICYKCLDELNTFIIMTVICIISTMSKTGNFIKRSVVTDFLNKISMIIYITHINGVWIVRRFFGELNDYDKIRIYFLTVAIFAIVTYLVVDFLGKKKL